MQYTLEQKQKKHRAQSAILKPLGFQHQQIMMGTFFTHKDLPSSVHFDFSAIADDHLVSYAIQNLVAQSKLAGRRELQTSLAELLDIRTVSSRLDV
jgi:hypothetical protein